MATYTVLQFFVDTV